MTHTNACQCTKCDQAREETSKRDREWEELERMAAASAANMGPAGPDQIFIEGYTLTEIIQAGLEALRNKA